MQRADTSQQGIQIQYELAIVYRHKPTIARSVQTKALPRTPIGVRGAGETNCTANGLAILVGVRGTVTCIPPLPRGVRATVGSKSSIVDPTPISVEPVGVVATSMSLEGAVVALGETGPVGRASCARPRENKIPKRQYKA